jgi:hypothetical protein
MARIAAASSGAGSGHGIGRIDIAASIHPGSQDEDNNDCCHTAHDQDRNHQITNRSHKSELTSRVLHVPSDR